MGRKANQMGIWTTHEWIDGFVDFEQRKNLRPSGIRLLGFGDRLL